MRADNTDHWWLRDDIQIIGFEDGDDDEGDEDEDADGDDEGDDEGSSDGDDEDADEDDEEGSEDDEDDSKPKSKKDTKGLVSALRKERMARKKAERLLRAAQAKNKPPVKKEDPPKTKAKAKDEEEDEGDDDASSAELATERAKGERLAKRLKDNAVDTAILKFAGDFKDPSEVLALIDRKDIEVDQDEDDPSLVEIDEESVEDAVKAFRKKKPHLLKSKEQRVPSGSKFGGRKKKSNEPSEQELRKKYPSLRR